MISIVFETNIIKQTSGVTKELTVKMNKFTQTVTTTTILLLTFNISLSIYALISIDGAAWKKKKLLTQIGTISPMHKLCMFRLIFEVKTKPKQSLVYICLLLIEKIIKSKRNLFFARFGCYIKYFLFIA